MQSSFGAALAFVLRQEGGYSDNPADPGGATNLGITRRTLAGWRKVSPWWNLPKTAVQALSAAEAGEIYRALYWSPVAGDDLPAGLDLAVFDFAVNSGPDRAARALQGIVGVAVDGRIGPKTLAAVGERAKVEGPVRVAGAQGVGGGLAGRAGGEGVLELVEGEQDAHAKLGRGVERRGVELADLRDVGGLLMASILRGACRPSFSLIK